MKKLTPNERTLLRAYRLVRGELAKKEEELIKLKVERKAGGMFVLLVLLIVFLLGNLFGHWVSNFLREPTWHSPKGCPLLIQGEGR